MSNEKAVRIEVCHGVTLVLASKSHPVNTPENQRKLFKMFQKVVR